MDYPPAAPRFTTEDLLTLRVAGPYSARVAEAPIQFGKYELVRPLAKGGMAEVFLARQLGPGGVVRDVVIKRVLPELSASHEFVTMFLDEARLAVRLSHPNVVQVFDFGEIDGSYFLVLEYLTGRDVDAILDGSVASGRRVPERITALIIAGACDGLQYVHSLASPDGRPLHVVHRDVSPSNLFVTDQGVVKVLDFGIAKAEGNVTRTQAGMVKGKVAYMAPEQIGQRPIDGRTDVFALGVVLHELLAGPGLFRRKDALSSMRAVLQDPIPPPIALRPDVSPALSAVAMRALARDPAERYGSAAEMRADLDGFLAELPFQPATDVLLGYLRDGRVPGGSSPRARGVPNPLGSTSPDRRVPTTEKVLVPPDEDRAFDRTIQSSAPQPRGDGALPAPWRRWLPLGLSIPLVVIGGLAGRYLIPTCGGDLPTLDPPASAATDPAAPPAAEPPVHLDPALAKRVLGKNGFDRGVLQITCVPGCHVYVDDQDTGQDSPTQPIYVTPGVHRVRAVDQLRHKEKTIDVKLSAGAQVLRTVHL